jgi:hypothetical protein
MYVTAIKRSEACAILDTGQMVHFATMIDVDGNETEDVSECAFAVVPLPDGRWEVIAFSDFNNVSTH